MALLGKLQRCIAIILCAWNLAMKSDENFKKGRLWLFELRHYVFLAKQTHGHSFLLVGIITVPQCMGLVSTWWFNFSYQVTHKSKMVSGFSKQILYAIHNCYWSKVSKIILRTNMHNESFDNFSEDTKDCWSCK